MRGLWAFGPELQGPNVLLDDSLAAETNKGLLNAVRDSVIQVRPGRAGAAPSEQWARREAGQGTAQGRSGLAMAWQAPACKLCPRSLADLIR